MKETEFSVIPSEKGNWSMGRNGYPLGVCFIMRGANVKHYSWGISCWAAVQLHKYETQFVDMMYNNRKADTESLR